MNDDSELLRRYLEGSEPAFRELVDKYVNLVYSAAMRHLTNAREAEDVVQTVFAALAQKARRLPQDVVLGGWLYRHTCFVAAQAGRTERRRQARERESVAMNASQEGPESKWEQLSPFLDQAMQRLGSRDRDAVVLRFFEKRNLQSVGAALGISEEAARKRVTRALEKLRSYFVRRGATLSASALGSLLAANAVGAAPPGLAFSAGSAALAVGATTTTSTLSLINLLTMTKLKIGICGTLIGAAILTPAILYHRAQTRMRSADAALREQAAGQARLEADHDRLTALASASRNQAADLERLRAEAETLRKGAGALPGVQKENRRLQTTVNKPTVEPTAEQEQAVMARMTYGKMAVFACMRHAQTNRGLFPSGFDRIAPALPEEMKSQTDPSGDAFEIVYSGPFKALTTLTNAAEVIVIRQREASPYGNRWAKVYVCADGHCEIHTQAEPDFSEWENQHMIAQSTAGR